MAKPNIAAVAYRTRTVCNTVKKNDFWYYYRGGGAPVPLGLGETCCDNGTIDGELTVADRKTRSRALRIKDRDDGTGLDE